MPAKRDQARPEDYLVTNARSLGGCASSGEWRDGVDGVRVTLHLTDAFADRLRANDTAAWRTLRKRVRSVLP